MNVPITLEFILSYLATLGILALFVLKYGAVRTKLLFLIFSFTTTGLFLLRFSRFWGSLLTIIGILIAAPYFAKGLKDIISHV